MKLYYSYILFSILILVSCNDNAERREIENLKDAEKKEVIFKTINKGWNFSNPSVSPSVQATVNTWSEWRSFLNELNLKPKVLLVRFRKKRKLYLKK